MRRCRWRVPGARGNSDIPFRLPAAPAMAEGQLEEGPGANLCQAGREGRCQASKTWAIKPAAAAGQPPGSAEGGVV